jgi:hypothetical protein
MEQGFEVFNNQGRPHCVKVTLENEDLKELKELAMYKWGAIVQAEEIVNIKA